MLYLPWFIIAVLLAVIAALGVKIYLFKKSISEIEILFAECLSADTNMLVTVSSRDKNIRSLAANAKQSLKTPLQIFHTICALRLRRSAVILICLKKPKNRQRQSVILR